MHDLGSNITIAVCVVTLLIGLIAFILYATGVIKNNKPKPEDGKKRRSRKFRAF